MTDHPNRSAASAPVLTERLIQAAVDYEQGRCSSLDLAEARAAVEAAIPADAQSVGMREALEKALWELTDLARPICSVFDRSTKKYEYEDEHVAKALPGTFEVIKQIRAALASQPSPAATVESNSPEQDRESDCKTNPELTGHSPKERGERVLPHLSAGNEVETYTEVCKSHNCPRGGVPVEIVGSAIKAMRDRNLNEPQAAPDISAGMTKAMEIVGEMRMSEAGIFDAKHSGQRGEDRSNALYDAYVAIRSALSRPESK